MISVTNGYSTARRSKDHWEVDMTKLRKLTTLALLFGIVLTMAPPTIAQGPDCPPIPVDQYGVPDYDALGLEYAGQYTEWLVGPFEFLGNEFGIGLHFDKHVDDDGRYWYTPSFYTALYMAITGWTPDFPDAPMAATMNVYELIAALAGRYEDIGITTEAASQALGHQVDNLQELSEDDMLAVFKWLGSSAEFWVDLNLYLLREKLAGRGEFSTSFMTLVYCGDPEIPLIPDSDDDNDSTSWRTPFPTDYVTPPVPTRDSSTPSPPPPPTPTPAPPNTPEPTPVPDHCPSPVITWQRPSVSFSTDPPFPIVVGQDPERVGWNVCVTIQSYPVVYEHWEWEIVGYKDETKTQCCHASGACQDDMAPCNNHWEDWSSETTTVQVPVYDCVYYKEVLPDPVELGAIRLVAKLNQESKNWIERDLAQRYPGAHVKHPDWEIIPPGGWHGDHIVSACINVPFEDPGTYDVVLDGRTHGTRHTLPFLIHEEFEQKAYLIETTLIK